MSCAEILEAVARGEEDQAAVAAHLSVCPDCRSRVGAARDLGASLRDPLMWEEPPDHLVEEIVAAVAQESGPPSRRRRWWVGGVAAALALVSVISVVVLSRPDWTMQLVPTAQAPGAAAVVSGWNEGVGTRLVIELSGLNQSDTDAYYELWLTAPDGSHVSAGTFRGSGRVELTAAVTRADYPRLWVTREPADDDPAPFGDTVLDTPGA